MAGAKDHIIKVNFKIGQKINMKNGSETSRGNESGITDQSGVPEVDAVLEQDNLEGQGSQLEYSVCVPRSIPKSGQNSQRVSIYSAGETCVLLVALESVTPALITFCLFILTQLYRSVLQAM